MRVAQKQKKSCCRTADEVAALESAFSHEPLAANEGTPLNPPVRITIISFRSRTCDTDGVSAKAAIDGIVSCGLLRDDSAKEVSEVVFRFEKVKNESEEKTLIVLEEL